MRDYKNEYKRLAAAKRLIKANFCFGMNKTEELTRLVYEISKRQNESPSQILKNLKNSANALHRFGKVKGYLLQKRYPISYESDRVKRFYLPKLTLRPKDVLRLNRRKFYPQNIFFQKQVRNNSIFSRFKKAFPDSKFIEISGLKQFVKSKRPFSIGDYNRRRDNIFLVEQKEDFFKRCPCTKNAMGCGYHIFNLGFGCIFECTYCYLQEYTNSPGIVLPANIDQFFDNFRHYKRANIRIGTGEFTDSLMLDDLTQYSPRLIEFFKDKKSITFEFKTKSDNISNVLKANHSGNIVISWSLNPQRIIEENEFLTPSLEDRIDAACRCIGAGYKIGFHLDPVLYFDGWQDLYIEMLDLLFQRIKEKEIAWLSLGTLRFNPKTKLIIENRFPGNSILNKELVYGYDSKLRYPSKIRYEIYKVLLEAFRKRYKKVKIYLCMEDENMWAILRGYKLNIL